MLCGEIKTTNGNYLLGIKALSICAQVLKWGIFFTHSRLVQTGEGPKKAFIS
jgi:hypothetical protein